MKARGRSINHYDIFFQDEVLKTLGLSCNLKWQSTRALCYMKLFHRRLPNRTLQTWVAPDFKMMKYLREIFKDHQWSWEFLHFIQNTLKSPLLFWWLIIWYKMIELKFWRVLEYYETRLWSHLFIWDSHLTHLDFHTYIGYELVNQFSYKHRLSYDNQYISYILLLCSIKHPQHQSPGCAASDLLIW